jgi:hypothetical protein
MPQVCLGAISLVKSMADRNLRGARCAKKNRRRAEAKGLGGNLAKSTDWMGRKEPNTQRVILYRVRVMQVDTGGLDDAGGGHLRDWMMRVVSAEGSVALTLSHFGPKAHHVCQALEILHSTEWQIGGLYQFHPDLRIKKAPPVGGLVGIGVSVGGANVKSRVQRQAMLNASRRTDASTTL